MIDKYGLYSTDQLQLLKDRKQVCEIFSSSKICVSLIELKSQWYGWSYLNPIELILNLLKQNAIEEMQKILTHVGSSNKSLEKTA
jgi:hypothetical protein